MEPFEFGSEANWKAIHVKIAMSTKIYSKLSQHIPIKMKKDEITNANLLKWHKYQLHYFRNTDGPQVILVLKGGTYGCSPKFDNTFLIGGFG